MGWWGDNVPEETLSRDEATRVVRRLFRMLRPWRALIIVAVLVLMAQAGTLLAGPLLARLGQGLFQGLNQREFDAIGGHPARRFEPQRTADTL